MARQPHTSVPSERNACTFDRFGDPRGHGEPHHLRPGNREPGRLRRTVPSSRRGGRDVPDAYWDLVITDVVDACAELRTTYDESARTDGFVSIEVAPELAHDSDATCGAARVLHERIPRPNLFVKIPATAEGVPAIRTMVSEGRSINVTLVFSLMRYAEVIDAYLDELEMLESAGGDLSSVHSVASFFVSRVDTEVDHRLAAIGTDEAVALRGRAAIAQAKLAYTRFGEQFSGARWDRLAHRGAHVQRLLWASTSTKDPTYPTRSMSMV